MLTTTHVSVLIQVFATERDYIINGNLAAIIHVA